MKVWSAIFNMIAIIIIAIMLIVFYKIEDTNARQFEEARLAQAIDYAVEGAFRAAVATDSISTDYTNGGLEEVQLNPSQIMDTFYNLVCLNYDMVNSVENKGRIENSVATAVLCCIDGYYILESTEIDSNPMDVIIGGEYKLKWGYKRPYLVYSQNNTRLFTANLVNEKTLEYQVGQTYLSRQSFDSSKGEDQGLPHTGLTREIVDNAISKLITEDINYAIHTRNINSTNNKMRSFYLPSGDTMTAINQIKSPSLIIIFQDSSFLNGYDIDISSVGGARVKVKSSVVGFTVSGDSTKYYCYAGQQLEETGVTVVERFDSLHEAAMAGFHPHIDWLRKPSFGKIERAGENN